ncbi:MAG: sigma 54-interacting transcriptional regulator [Thermoanaerobaculia bacterium]|nr:sigma 54-interacting transcriptional regulator [Thermoanaerobaculia bacterium]
MRVAICDLRMPGMDGLAFLQEVRRRELGLSVVLLTAFGSIESAVDAMKVGADDYLTKPVDLYELRRRVTNLLENRRLREEVSSLQERLDKRFRFEAILGRSAAMEQLFEQMRAVAPTRSTVLLVGESGTGKELVANALHHASPRRDERFLAINCGAIPSDILESELFGHEKGSFTGAVGRKIGKFELAHRGTLFLDEISELYPELQVKLLRVLEERRVMRVGGAISSRSISASSPPPTASSSARWRPAASARTSTTGSRSSPCASRRCANGGRTSRCSPSTTSSASVPSTAASRCGSPPTRSRRWSSTPGRATCASCATWSRRSSSSTAGARSAAPVCRRRCAGRGARRGHRSRWGVARRATRRRRFPRPRRRPAPRLRVRTAL